MRAVLMILLLSVSQLLMRSQTNLNWANKMGGTGTDRVFNTVTDVNGDVYITGYFSGTVDFDPGPGAFILNAYGTLDGYVCKINSAGSLLWARQFGGSNATVSSNAITVDDSGNIYLSGHFSNMVDFDPGASNTFETAVSPKDAFILKMDKFANLKWIKRFGEKFQNSVLSTASDFNGSIYAIGFFSDTIIFTTSSGYDTLSSAGQFDAFILKLDSSGNCLWTASTGDSGDDIGVDIAIDEASNILVCGHFNGTPDFDPGPGVNTLSSGFAPDVFLLKLSSSGSFVSAINIGGTSTCAATDIALDQSGNVILSGYFFGTADFDPGTGVFNLTSTQSTDGYICKLDSTGSFSWAVNYGGAGSSTVSSVCVDNLGNIYSTGYFAAACDFDPDTSQNNITSLGQEDVFISILNPAGKLTAAQQIGGSNYENGKTIALDPSGSIYLTGSFASTPADFDPGAGVFNLSSAGDYDIFVCKFDNTVGISESIQQNEFSFQLFPNPASDEVKILFENHGGEKISLEIFDVSGKRIHSEQRAANSGVNYAALDVSKLNAGIYFVKLITANGESVQKLLIGK